MSNIKKQVLTPDIQLTCFLKKRLLSTELCITDHQREYLIILSINLILLLSSYVYNILLLKKKRG